MRQVIIVAGLAIAVSLPALALGQQANSIKPTDPPNMGHAPAKDDGIGRLDLRIVDQAGNPIQGAQAHLASKRAGGFLCESWSPTNATGQAVLPPLHVGQLKLTIKAKGFETVSKLVPAADLAQPVRVTMTSKK